MGVPDELRLLDEDLAAGRVDAESYRRRRDALLAARLPDPPGPTVAAGMPACRTAVGWPADRTPDVGGSLAGRRQAGRPKAAETRVAETRVAETRVVETPVAPL